MTDNTYIRCRAANNYDLQVDLLSCLRFKTKTRTPKPPPPATPHRKQSHKRRNNKITTILSARSICNPQGYQISTYARVVTNRFTELGAIKPRNRPPRPPTGSLHRAARNVKRQGFSYRSNSSFRKNKMGPGLDLLPKKRAVEHEL